MKRLYFYSLILFLLASSVPFYTAWGSPQKNGAIKKSSYVIAAYVFSPRRKLTTGMIKAKELTRVVYAFSLIRNGKAVLVSPVDKYNVKVLDSLRQVNPNLQVMISVGGWAGSKHFSDAVLTPSSRKKFVNSVVNLVKEYNLDGIDIDWEFPGQMGKGNVYRESDGRNFTLMLKLLRQRFNQLEKQQGSKKHYLITLAAGARKKYLVHFKISKALKYLDAVNLMTYVYHMQDSTALTTPVYTAPEIVNHPEKSTASSTKYFIKGGVPAGKIIVGATLGGTGWTGVQPVDHGLYKPYVGKLRAFLSFKNLKKNYINKNGFVRYWDSWAKAPYLWNAKKHIFISYSSPRSMKAKCEFVKEHHLGGIMFWAYPIGNKNPVLLNVMYQVLH